MTKMSQPFFKKIYKDVHLNKIILFNNICILETTLFFLHNRSPSFPRGNNNNFYQPLDSSDTQTKPTKDLMRDVPPCGKMHS